jgi:CubicO group peptidase (beta-lactamase class C family)
MIESGNFTLPSPPPSSDSLKLDWASPISSILREDFVLQDAWATEHLTIEDALSHRTGMPRHDKALSRKYDRQNATVKAVTRSLRYLPLAAPPRTRWQYCNHMYGVLSHAIETLTGRWLGHVLKDWIWEPLGMKSTYFSLEDAINAPEDFATGYAWDNGTGDYVSIPYMPLQEVSGAGSVISNALDYAAWIRALLHNASPLTKDGLDAIKTPKLFSSGKPQPPMDTPMAYGSAWFTTSYKGHRYWTHSGGMHAYGAEVYFFPELDFGVVMFGNTAVTSNYVEQILCWHLIDEKLGVSVDERFDWDAR